MIRIKQLRNFEKVYKKLHQNQKLSVDNAIKIIMDNPQIGQRKAGDLSEIYVYKFTMIDRLTLIGYKYYEEELIIMLIAIGSHENFYRDIKRN